VLEGALAGALNDRSVGEGVAEGDAEFDDAGTRVDGGEDDVARGGEVRVAAGDVGDKRWLIFEVEGHEGSIVDCRGRIAEARSCSDRALTRSLQRQNHIVCVRAAVYYEWRRRRYDEVRS